MAKKAVKKKEDKALEAKPVEKPKKAPTSKTRNEMLKRFEKKLERSGPVKLRKDPEDPTGTRITVEETDSFEMHCQFFETTGIHTHQAAFRLIEQAYQAQPQSHASWNNTTRLMHEIEPKDGLEGMLAAQMVAVHSMAMECSRRAMVSDQHPEAVERNINRASKLMKTFAVQMEALQKYRTKGQQKIVVQHVQVSDGGQAIIGDVQQRGDRG